MIRGFLRSILWFWLLALLITQASNWLEKLLQAPPPCEDELVLNTMDDVTHRRGWRTTVDKNQCMTYVIERAEYENAFRLRNGLSEPPPASSFNAYWGHIYAQFTNNRSQPLDGLIDSLTQIQRDQGLDRAQLAHSIVSFVQDIPYVLVSDCELADQGAPCVDGGEYGILAPTEFLYALTGDCDTRTVVLYLLLSEFGYDPLIMVSREYTHAMLALDVEGAGFSVTHRNRNYYFWETTNIGWKPGMISPDMRNPDYWHIALYNEY